MRLEDAEVVLGLGQGFFWPVIRASDVVSAQKKYDELVPTIKRAYKRCVFEHHPDRGGDVQKFRIVKNIYELLSHPEMATTIWSANNVARPASLPDVVWSSDQSSMSEEDFLAAMKVAFTGSASTGTGSTTSSVFIFDGDLPFFVRRF